MELTRDEGNLPIPGLDLEVLTSLTPDSCSSMVCTLLKVVLVEVNYWYTHSVHFVIRFNVQTVSLRGVTA